MRKKRKNRPGKPGLKSVQRQFNIWRGKRKGREAIPERLWFSAVRLTKEMTVNQVSRALGLNHTALSCRVAGRERRKKRASREPRHFVELDWKRPGGVGASTGYEVELEDAGGRKLRVRGTLPGEFMETARTLWRLGG